LTPESSLGFEVCDFARDVLGIDLLPWQEWLFVHGLELKPDGSYRFRTVLVLVARQNGKTTALMVLALWRLVMDAARLVLGTSTNLDYARESWLKATELAWGPAGKSVFAGVPELDGEFTIPRYANGEQTLSTVDGARYKIGTATRRGGRSLAVDLLILDELREHRTWDAWSASSKTTNARPRGQRWALSNMGDDGSVVLNHLQAQALRTLETGEGDDSLGIFEWSAPDGCDPADRSVWPLANPALGHTILEETLAADLATDPPEVFLTEVLCRRVPNLEPRPIDLGLWAGLARKRQPKLTGTPVFCLDVTPSLHDASIGVAQLTARHMPFLDLADHRRGTDWLVERTIELRDKYEGAKFLALATGAVAAILPDLLKAGIEVDVISATAMGKACVYLQKATIDASFVHSGNPLFAIALDGATARPYGEGLWLWGWRKSTADLSPIAAITGALWGLAQQINYDVLESVY
jgi:phage terminase large subunit-like protein